VPDRARLNSARGGVVLDLRELIFMDCTGIHVVVAASNRARQAGAHLVLVRRPSQVDRLFAVVGTGFPKLAIGLRWPSAAAHDRLPH
jgi:anti-anti-sigma factor